MPLSADFHGDRRRRLIESIGAGAAALVPAAAERLRSNDVEYRFRQSSDLDYLTGFPEPDALCVLLPGHPDHEYVLFVRPRDPERETWTGRRAGVEGAVATYGADAAFPLDELDATLPRMLEGREEVYYSIDRHGEYNARVLGWIESLQNGRQRSGAAPAVLRDIRLLLHELRLIKRPEEIAAMRRAAEVTCEAHRRAMSLVRADQYEFEVEAQIEFTFRSMGAAGPAYPSIVASGANATTLHYTENCRRMEPDDLLLIDAGAEVNVYCGDVTRTFPVGDRFDGRQRAIYEIVLAAQEAAIIEIRPGVRVEDVHNAAVRTLVRGLIDLKILAGRVDDCIAEDSYRPYFMHRTSHWLGKDVHDVGLYKVGGDSRRLEPGMILTVEPGLYLAEDGEAPPQWRGIGVRIEDDVLVTEAGFEVLTEWAPKEIDEIEAMRRAV